MCGRFVQKGPGTLAKKLGVEAPPDSFRAITSRLRRTS